MFKSLLAITTLSVLTNIALAASTGQAAPAFTAKDVDGKSVSLADYLGKTVVLEWVNPGCPFVRKHYDAANMQGTQKAAAAKGVIWLAINSTEPTHTDYLAPPKLAQWMASQNAVATRVVMDESLAGKAISAANTKPYGYSVKYK
jgi:AhpC/TSA family